MSNAATSPWPTALSLTPIDLSALIPPSAAGERDSGKQPTLSTHLLDLALDQLSTFPDPAAGWKRLADRPGANGGEGAKVESYRSADGWAGRRSEHRPDELSWEHVVVRRTIAPLSTRLELTLPVALLRQDHVYHRHYETESEFVPTLKAFSALAPSPLPLGPLPSRLAPTTSSSSSSVEHQAGLFKLHYAMPTPLQPRTFVVGLLQTLDQSRRELWTVTVPVDHPDVPRSSGKESGRVRAAYASIERIRQIEGDRLEWSYVLRPR